MIYGLNVVPQHGYRVNVEPVDGNVRAISVKDAEPDGGLPFSPTIQPAHQMGRPIDPTNVPTKMVWKESKGYGVPDFNDSHILNVSARAMSIIEDIEPNIHQFISASYVNSKGDIFEERYFLIVCNRLDSVDREASRMELIKGMMWSGDNLTDPLLVLNEGKVAGHHLWIDKHLLHGTFVSEALGKAFGDAQLTGFKLSEMHSV